MANDRLRQALQDAGLQPDQLAALVAVDDRTVRRWLSGVTPYARHRSQIARALDSTEHDLWPEVPQAAVSDTLAGYVDADDPNAPTTEALISDATDRIELLDNALDHLREGADLTDLLLTKASQGCQVRILVATPDPSLAPLLAHEKIEIRLIPAPPNSVIRRADDQMLVVLSLDNDPDQLPVLLHVRERRAPGLFDRLAGHYEHIWEHASETLATQRDLDRHLHGHHPDAGLPEDSRGTAAVQEDLRKSESAPPRRWPRRTP